MSLASRDHVTSAMRRGPSQAKPERANTRHPALVALMGTLCGVALSLTACGPDYPKCDNDEDCHQGEFCVNNLCQQCRTNDDCAAGQRCANGACEAIPGYCTSNSQCASGQVCENNMCVAQRQTTLREPPAAPSPSGCDLTPVYFDYDSSTLSDSARDQLSRNASCVRERGVRSIQLTGMTDPRGTEEYNLALGERRAQAAQQYLKSLGAESVAVSSMGEEVASGTDEASWSRDRRVDFKAR
jgi:peptidoglycan-associated lipoprotein